MGASGFEASAAEMVNLISQTFFRSGTDLTVYSDAQVDQGLWYLVSSSGSNYMVTLKSADAPLKARLEAIENIYHLYADCFARRCTEVLGHLSEEGSDLNSSCYMFWDICPIAYLEYGPEKAEIDKTIFQVLERTLLINHRACREGALHGLGHMQFSAPGRAKAIIDRFLTEAKPDEALVAYAQDAREGNVQ